MTTDTIFETIEKQCAAIAKTAQAEIAQSAEAFNKTAKQIQALISGTEATATPAAMKPATKKKKTTRKAKKAAPATKAIEPQVEAIIADATAAAAETAETEAA